MIYVGCKHLTERRTPGLVGCAQERAVGRNGLERACDAEAADIGDDAALAHGDERDARRVASVGAGVDACLRRERWIG